MAEDRVIELLEEIRDLQKMHAENYKDALKNQELAIEVQKHAMRRQKIALMVCAALLALLVGVLFWSSFPAKS